MNLDREENPPDAMLGWASVVDHEAREKKAGEIYHAYQKRRLKGFIEGVMGGFVLGGLFALVVYVVFC